MGENFHILRVPPVELKVTTVERSTPVRATNEQALLARSRNDARSYSFLRNGDTVVGHVLEVQNDHVVLRLTTATIRATVQDSSLRIGDRLLFRISGEPPALRLSILGLIQEKDDPLLSEKIRSALAIAPDAVPDILLEQLATKGIILRKDISWWKQTAEHLQVPISELMNSPETIDAARLLRDLHIPISVSSMAMAKIYGNDASALKALNTLVQMWERFPVASQENMIKEWGLESFQTPFRAGAVATELLQRLQETLSIKGGTAQAQRFTNALAVLQQRFVAESILNMSAFTLGAEQKRMLLLQTPPQTQEPILPVIFSWKNNSRSSDAMFSFAVQLMAQQTERIIRLEGSLIGSYFQAQVSSPHADIVEALEVLLPELVATAKRHFSRASVSIGAYSDSFRQSSGMVEKHFSRIV